MANALSLPPAWLKSVEESRWLLWLLPLISGILLTLSFAPIDQHWLGIICPLILSGCWQHATPRKAFLMGLIFGGAFFGTSVSWVFVSIHSFGGTNVFVAGLVTLLFILVLALFPAINGWLVRRFYPISAPVTLLLAYPACWVLIEWIRSWIFTGFPWVLLGYSQMHWPLAGWATLGSVYLVSFVTAMCASTLLILIQNTGRWRWAALCIFVALQLIGSWAYAHHWTHSIGKRTTVSLLQGNIQQSLKWNPDFLQHSVNVYTALTEQHWNSQLIIWPESALPTYPQYAQNYLGDLSAIALQHHTSILIGAPLMNNVTKRYYNGAIVVGEGHGSYRKRHLVPFGEYIPLSWVVGKFFQFMNIPMSSFSPGKAQQALLMMNGLSVSPFICYEIAFPMEVRRFLQQANLIVVISDDAWFGDSLGPLQQQQMSEMRALETGRYVVNATNNGVTSIVGPDGREIDRAPQFQRTSLTGAVYPMAGKTPWLMIGWWPWLALFIAILILVGWYQYKNSGRKR